MREPDSLDNETLMEADDDPDVALSVILGETRGNKAYAVICLAIAIKRGKYPRAWGAPAWTDEKVRGELDRLFALYEKEKPF
jgi:hypothetical protein